MIRFNAEGLAGLVNRPHGHRAEILSESEQAMLVHRVLLGPNPDCGQPSSWTLPDLFRFIEERFGKAEADFGDHPLEPGSCDIAGSRSSEILVDDHDLGPTEGRKTVAHGILQGRIRPPRAAGRARREACRTSRRAVPVSETPGRPVAAAKDLAGSLLDHLMDVDDASGPRMPPVDDLSSNTTSGPMGIPTPSCTTRFFPTEPLATVHPTSSSKLGQPRDRARSFGGNNTPRL